VRLYWSCRQSTRPARPETLRLNNFLLRMCRPPHRPAARLQPQETLLRNHTFRLSLACRRPACAGRKNL
jgi:hypothetical protein